ncbi:MAG: hypothetical protein GIS02_04980 [Methanosarcinales archaeon]|uniref:Uncharacterized protein n=1 Tax=Candidatus Ethanoperedens thermophilum TaxID=2766897 RepID=A0A848DAK1_9EURY|nr:hypothetical protein [Candidatus Ethanoperedens thermophilum]
MQNHTLRVRKQLSVAVQLRCAEIAGNPNSLLLYNFVVQKLQVTLDYEIVELRKAIECRKLQVTLDYEIVELRKAIECRKLQVTLDYEIVELRKAIECRKVTLDCASNQVVGVYVGS